MVDLFGFGRKELSDMADRKRKHAGILISVVALLVVALLGVCLSCVSDGNEIAEKAPYVYSILGVEIMSILLGFVLLYGNIFETRERTLRNRLYSYAVLSCVVALAADAISWIAEGCARLEPILYASTVISLIMTFVNDNIFIAYIIEYVREMKSVSTVLPRIFMALSAIVIALIAASAGTGLLFTYENGVYVEGELYGGYIIVNLLLALFCLLIVLTNMKVLSVHDRLATMTFILFPCMAGCVNLFVETFSYAYPATILSMTVLYVMIQSKRQDRLEREGSVSYYHARHDALTGLNNRLSYEERLKALSASDVNVAAVFTDVNGLKLTNDRFGHEAGDRLLIRYAELMCRFFRKEDVFRISGDEFTILLENMNEEALAARMDAFRNELNEDGIPRASIGMAIGNGCDVAGLIRQAEAAMYDEKIEFHRQHLEIGMR